MAITIHISIAKFSVMKLRSPATTIRLSHIHLPVNILFLIPGKCPSTRRPGFITIIIVRWMAEKRKWMSEWFLPRLQQHFHYTSAHLEMLEMLIYHIELWIYHANISRHFYAPRAAKLPKGNLGEQKAPVISCMPFYPLDTYHVL